MAVSSLAKEVSVHLRVPGLIADPEDRLTRILKDARTRRPLKVVVRNGQTVSVGRPKKKAKGLPPWLDGRDDDDLSEEEYLKRYMLDEYGRYTRAGKLKTENALRLWVNNKARPMCRGLILAGKTDAEIAAQVRSMGGPLMGSKQSLRPIDVKAFRDLFWDFSGWDAASLRVWLKLNLHSSAEYTAATLGADTMLWQMGVTDLELDELQMFSLCRNVAYSQIAKFKAVPEEFDYRTFNTAYEVLKDSDKHVREILALQGELGANDFDQLQMSERDDFANLDTIMAEAEKAAEYQLVRDVWARGGLTDEDYRALEMWLDDGQFLVAETRVGLRDFLEVSLAAEDEEEGEKTTTVGPERVMEVLGGEQASPEADEDLAFLLGGQQETG
jgi:hypothetical protein